MQKIIIHNYTDELSYAFSLAEWAYRRYEISEEAGIGENLTCRLFDRIISVRKNDKSITVTIREKEDKSNECRPI